MKRILCALILLLALAPSALRGAQYSMKQSGRPPANAFVSIADVDPSIVLDIRYYSDHNFVGKRIDGYLAPKCLLTREAAEAISKAQTELKSKGYSLKIYDCFRPQRAVDHFDRWAKDIDDTKMKAEFYPEVDKSTLFEEGYIARRSGHSRGSTVDLTIVPLPVPSQETYKDGDRLFSCELPAKKRFRDNGIDMGTGFDCFSSIANTDNPTIGRAQKKNRQLLKSVMEKYNFKNYDKEWWHYTLQNEPFPDRYFDFLVE